LSISFNKYIENELEIEMEMVERIYRQLKRLNVQL